MKTIVAFVIVFFAWMAFCACYMQFMIWYDCWCRRNDRTSPFDSPEDHE